MDNKVMTTDERLKNLVAHFVLKNNYWGYLFSRIARKPTEQSLLIMGVAPESNGTITLYYNKEAVDGTDDKTLITVLEHEGMHLLNKHIPRLLRIISNEINDEQKFKKYEMWNIAADCCVNTQANIPKRLVINGKPIDLCFPELYKMEDGKATEWYYNTLLDQESKANECGGTMDFSGLFDKLDDHTGWKKAANDKLKGVSDLSSLSRKVENYVNDIVNESVKTFNKQRGKLPGHVEELINELLAPPKVPYFQIIRKLVRGSRLSKFKRTPTRINRKRTYVFQLGDDPNVPAISPFPGRMRDFSFNIVILIDTSGSMSKDDILEGLSGIKNIIENDRHCKVTVLENDTQLQKEYEVKKLRDIDFKVKGSGGTTLAPGLERARELKADVTLTFTDGGCDNINEIDRKLLPKKIIWVIQKDGTARMVNQTGFVVRI